MLKQLRRSVRGLIERLLPSAQATAESSEETEKIDRSPLVSEDAYSTEIGLEAIVNGSSSVTEDASDTDSDTYGDGNEDKVLTADEYRLLVLRFVANGQSHTETLEELFPNKSKHHAVVLNTVHEFYVEALSEIVAGDVLDNIVELCCRRNREFLSDVKKYEQAPLDSQLWRELPYRTKNRGRAELEDQQLRNLADVLKDEPRKQKQILAKFRKALSKLVPHFSIEKSERQLLEVIVSWFKSGEMTLPQFLVWFDLMERRTVEVDDLKHAEWPEADETDLFFNRFQIALEDIPTSLSTENQEKLDRFVAGIKTTTEEVQESVGKRFKVHSKLFFLSGYKDRLEKHLKDDQAVFEVNINAEYAIIVDCSLCNEDWHGINLSLVAEKIIIRNKCEINLSGRGYNRDVRGKAKSGKNGGERGEDGSHGAAGESSGNFFLCANDVKNPHYLKILLHGGDGEGGQDGGDGVSGIHGRGNGQRDLDELMPHYDSLYFCNWENFFSYIPNGCDHLAWDQTFGWTGPGPYVERTFRCEDGREIDFAVAVRHFFLFHVTDFRFVIRGAKGTMGSEGGANGVGGEGGNRGEFTARTISSGNGITGFVLEANKGRDGHNGQCGTPGNPGSNGDDVALIDRSGGWSWWDKRAKRVTYGVDRRQKLGYSYHYSSEAHTRLSGFRKYVLGVDDCFVAITTSDVDEIQRTKRTEERRASDRPRRSQAISKQNISIDMILDEYANRCVSEEIDVRYDAGAEFNARVEEEVEEEEETEEQVAVIRTRSAGEQIHSDRKEHRRSLEPELVLERIHGAVDRELTAEDLISLCNDVFSVPIDISGDTKTKLDRLTVQLESRKLLKSAFQSRNCLRNGMFLNDVQKFSKEVRAKLKDKQSLSSIPEELTIEEGSVDLTPIERRDELFDVCPISLNDFWKAVDDSAFQNRELDKFFSQLEYKSASTDLLIALNEVYQCLREHKKVFEIYQNSELNWCNPEEAKTFLRTFASHEEQKSFQEEDLADQEQSREERCPMPISCGSCAPRESVGSSPKEVAQESSESKWSSFTGSVSSFFKSNENESFMDVRKLLKNHSAEIAKAFERLTQIVENDIYIYARIAIEKSKLRVPVLPGSTPMSLVHMYFFSREILEYSLRLFRYHQQYEKSILTPCDWFSGKDDTTLGTDEFISVVKTNGMPENHSDLRMFMLRNGIRCAAYRLFAADVKNVNVKVYCDSGYSRMRLVENFNPSSSDVQKLHISKEGNASSVGAEITIRKLREILQHSQRNLRGLNIPIPFSEETLDLNKFFSANLTVEEWSSALEVAAGPKFSRFLQKLFSLRGCPFSTQEFQFVINTVLELVCNYDMDEDSLISFILSKNGAIHDVWLALRIFMKMKENSPEMEDLVESLEAIENPVLKALFVSKLHDVELDKPTLRSLIDMLAHAGNKVEQLETISLAEWIDIARCQTWECYAREFEIYGTIGYFFVFLKSFKNPEAEYLRRIVDDLAKEGAVMIFEKVISRISFAIAYEGQQLSEQTIGDIRKLFVEANAIITEGSADFDALCQSGHAQKFGNVYLLTNESIQNAGIKQLKNLAEWNRVFPQNDRTLSNVISLTINPQDDEQQRENRRATMAGIKDVLERPVDDDPHIALLQKIDDVLFEERRIRLRDTQKVAILAAVKNEKNLLSQVNTGEGKSYIIAALAILRIKTGQARETVDIITSSSVLAQRDAERMRAIYEAFNISVSHNCDEDVDKRTKSYNCDVVYGDIARFERDHLLHHFYKRNILGSRTRCNVIVDEVDSMLLDNGSNMLYLSHNIPGLELLESLFLFIHKQIYMPEFAVEDEVQFNSQELRKKVLMDMCGLITKKDIADLLCDEKGMSLDTAVIWRLILKNHIVNEDGILLAATVENVKALAEELKIEFGVALAGRVLAMITMVLNRRREITVPGYLKRFALAHLDEFIDNAKKALFLQHNDEYVVDVDHTGRRSDLQPLVTIIDRGTGTDLSTSQWSEGLHQFLQLKHGCRLSPLSLKAVFVSNVSYLKGYLRLNGFSGTLGSKEESNSLVTLYDADLVRIPTWKAKDFSEKAPVLASTTEQWIKGIYDEICNQVLASRSVLIICRSIADVETIHEGLLKLYEQEESRKSRLEGTFGNIILYRRDFEDFDFSRTGGLKTSRVVIATNLAGRGTDITLTEELTAAGGLHVIVSFLPENSRIEDQAYGRSARCGEPGSGQIITLVEDSFEKDPSIFELKQIRDNAEVHRLRSLKQLYDYRTAVEETCLTHFKDHCSNVLASVYSHSEDSLPTLMQTVYFALLDEWAMWLDGKSEAIKRCELNKSNQEKEQIIESVKEFLAKHPLPNLINPTVSNQDVKTAFAWITCPQPFLTSVLIDIANDDHESAMTSLDKVLRDFPEFAAEAYYYKGIIKQQKIRRIKDGIVRKAFDAGIVQNILEASHMSGLFNEDDAPEFLIENEMEMLAEATFCLLNARGLFTARAQQKNVMSKVISKLQQNPSAVKSRGFVTQQEEAIAVLETLIGHIDDLIGHTAKPEDVALQNEPPSMHVRRFREYRRAGIFSPTTLSKSYTMSQLQMISYNHGIAIPALISAFTAINESDDIDDHDGLKIVTPEILYEAFSMPSVTGFWDSLRRAGCFSRERVYIAVKKSNSHLVNVVEDLRSTTLKKTPFQIQLSENVLDDCDLYDLGEAKRTFEDNDAMNHELQECLEAGTAWIEVVAEIDPFMLLLSIEHLDQFDFVTKEIVMRELDMSATEASWVLKRLVDEHVLESRVAELSGKADYANNNDKNDDKDTNAKDNHNLVKEYEEEDSRDDINAEDDQEEDITSYVEEEDAEDHDVIDDVEDTEVRNDHSMDLVEASIDTVENTEDDQPEEEVIYILVDKVNCDSFPENIRPMLEQLMTKYFCYGYALKSLQSSVREELSGKDVVHRIMLPRMPYLDLHADLLSCGILNHERVTRLLKEVYEPEGGNCINGEIYDRLEKKAPWISLNKSKLISTVDFLREKCILPGPEMRKVIAGGMRQLAVIVKPNPWRWALGLFLILAPIAIALGAIFLGPVAFAIGLVALAAVGTTLFVLAAMGINRKMHSKVSVETVDEFKILREFHEIAITHREEKAREAVLNKETHRIIGEFVDQLVKRMQLGCLLTRSTEDVTTLEDLISKSCENSEHLPFLKAGIRRWFISHAYDLQLSQFGSVFDEDTEIRQTACSNPPNVLFAFGSLLVSDINLTIRGMNRKIDGTSTKCIMTRLRYDEYIDILNNEAGEEFPDQHLSGSLRNSLRRTIEPILNECIREIMQPAINTIESVKKERRAARERTIKPDKKRIAKRKEMYDAEVRAKSSSSDLLAADLHSILLRICFREPKPQVIQHMIHYNYPLSAHCGTVVFDGVADILKDLCVGTLSIELERDNQAIFTYKATLRTDDVIEDVKIILGLQKNCFYVCGRGKTEMQTKFPVGLFEALSETVRGFSDKFPLGAEQFAQELEKIIGDSTHTDNSWAKKVQWHSSEKLFFPV
ncbi:hypothetical protein ANCCAN_00574 [Ancylostoma caninum]|uniref:Uncharacterized protein n=1 Tax=Ancylostoma caninum TaxID=29170 RepID=A0A368H8Z3_ANCCA|nr:hypothetical protein ANCCAN_00574 [Ancylostoma caninum]